MFILKLGYNLFNIFLIVSKIVLLLLTYTYVFSFGKNTERFKIKFYTCFIKLYENLDFAQVFNQF